MKLPKFEHLYCGFTFDLPYRHKWGISIKASGRWTNIKKELSQELGRDITVFVLPLPILFARHFEQFIFRLFRWARYTGLKISTGRTEYYWSINVFSFLIAWALMYYFGVQDGKWKSLFLLLLPVPIDGFLVIIIIFLLQWSAIWLIIWRLVLFIS